MSNQIAQVNIVMFKGADCALCEVVEPIIRQIVNSSKGSATLTLIDTSEEKELTLKYDIHEIPEVLYNDEVVLSAKEASELISGEFGNLMNPDSSSQEFGGGFFEMQSDKGSFSKSDLNFDYSLSSSSVVGDGGGMSQMFSSD